MTPTGSHSRILINPANPPLPLIFRHMGNILFSDTDRAGIQRNASANQIQERGFTRTIGAYYRHKFSVTDSQGKIIKQTHFIDSTCIVIFLNMI